VEQAVHVGDSCPFADGPGVAPILRGERQRAEELGWRFTTLDACLSPALQARQLERLWDLGVDALTSWTLDPELTEPHYARAAAAGIPLVTFSSDTPSAAATIRQQADSAAPAEDAAAYIAERVGRGPVLVVGGPPVPALAARTTHFLAAAEQAGLEIAGRDDNVGDVYDTAVPVVEGLLERCPHPAAVWCFNDYTALAAADVLRRHAAGEAIVTGIGGIPAAIASIREGGVTATYDSLPIEAGRAAIDAVADLLAGRPCARDIEIPCVRYDRANLASFVPWDER
jgi:ribose transport system substrate-binding protein